MKMLLSIIAMMGLAGAAQAAEVITLLPGACGNARACSPQTSPSVPLTLSATYGNHTVVTIGNVVYDSLGQLYLGDYVNVPLWAPDASYILLTAHFRSYSTKLCAGRGGCHSVVHYDLLGGSVAL